MKTSFIPGCLALCLLCSPLWAKLCPSCRSDLPAQANFCLTCGLQQPAVPAPPEPRLPGHPVEAGQSATPVFPPEPQDPSAWQENPPPPQPTAAVQSSRSSRPAESRSTPAATATFRKNRDTLFKIFTPVDTFEKAIKSGTYSNIVGGFPEFKSTFASGLRKFEQARAHLPEELRLLGQMYIEKAQACEGVVAALNGMRMDSPFRDALLLYYGQVLSWYNKSLQKGRTISEFTHQDLAALRSQANYIDLRCKRHEITAKFLRIGGTDVPRGGAFAVLEVKNRKAMVLVLCETPTDEPVQGWMSLPALESRTTWTAKHEYAFSRNPFIE